MDSRNALQRVLSLAAVTLLLLGCGPQVPSSGEVTGTLVGATSNRPIAGAVMVLCEQVLPLVKFEETCIFDKELVTLTGSDGSFEFASVPPGSYTPLYVLPGEEYELAVDSLTDGQTIPLRPPFEVSIDQRTITGASYKNLELEEGNLVGGAAAIPLIGLTIEYQNGPLTVAVNRRHVEIDIRATDL